MKEKIKKVKHTKWDSNPLLKKKSIKDKIYIFKKKL